MNLKNVLLFHLACLAAATPAFSQGFGSSELLHEWQFHLGDDVDPESPDRDAADWRPVIVPHDWSVEYPADPGNASCTGYLPGGIGWYRTELDIPTDDSGQRHYLYFEGVYNRSEVFLNGERVGGRPNGYVSFMCDITPHLKPGQSNTVAVRVDHSLSADSRWYTGSGIYRPVHLVTANPLHIALWGLNYWTTVDEKGASWVLVDTQLQNHHGRGNEAGAAAAEVTVIHELQDPEGRVVARESRTVSVENQSEANAHARLAVSEPQLWSVDHPNLYTLDTRIVQNDHTIDSTSTKVGIRTLSFDPDRGFALNGEWMNIKGVCLHHDAGVLGAAVPKVVWRERLLQLKKLGCNGIRMSHNPQATALYELCDELGFLVMDEAFDEWEYPKKKWLEGWNKGEPGFQGSADFFHEWAERDLADMVRRDRNHPSVIMWSIGNEVDYPNDPYSHPILDKEGIGQQHVPGYKEEQPPAERLGAIAKKLAAVAREHDTSRPVTAALAGVVMSNVTEYPYVLDVVGYNYTEHRYEMDHERYPDRVLYGSETRHDLEAWKAVSENDYVFGQFIWTGIDYLGEAGPWPSRGFTTGMIDLANNIKPRGHFRRALWAEEPVAYLGTYSLSDPGSEHLSIDAGRSWNYEDDQLVRVVCYTNGDEAELFLNGETVGERKPQDPDTAIIHWDVPYQSGELEVVAYRAGEASVADSIRPDGEPRVLEAETKSGRLDSKYSVAIVPVTVTDAQGNLVYEASKEVTCTVSGAGRLLGLENASRDASENHRDHIAETNNGRLTAYVQALADDGSIEVMFTAPGLEPATVSLEIGL